MAAGASIRQSEPFAPHGKSFCLIGKKIIEARKMPKRSARREMIRAAVVHRI